MQTQTDNHFWQFDISYWFQKLNTSENGLTTVQAEIILKQSGTHKRELSRFEKDLLLFVGQFKSPLMLMLIAAVILSAFLGDTSDGIIILFIVLSTGILCFLQERNAGRVVEKLQSLIALKSMVWRDGKAMEILSSKLVPGDIVLFKSGDIVPADCLLIESNELYVNEASLTGESFPVRKQPGILDEHTVLAKRSNCLWQGTNIVSGSGKALVIATGENTIFGKISKAVSATTETAFEKGIKDFGYFLMKVTLVLSVFILLVNLLNHKPIMESALFALALAVGMAPELLPAIATIAMSAGAKRMLQQKVIVKKLAAIQNLGAVNLLCTDKTGTITEGAICVSGVVDISQKESEYVKQLAFLNASLESGYTNPIDEALRNLEVSMPVIPQKVGEIPYDFIRKRLSIAVDTGKEKLLITKGAFEKILEICMDIRMSDGKLEPFDDHLLELKRQFEDYAGKGFRVIGVCYKNIIASSIIKEEEHQMIFAGFVILEDPVKPGIIDTLNELKKLQVGLKVITGDNRNVAKCIGVNIGMKEPIILTGDDLMLISTEALQQKAKATHIFAEVEPHQKERIIQALRKSYTVAYMGDGINDVAAINMADTGISVENAVDVAREAADFVLMEKNLMVLADGIREGRKTFSNTLKYIFINTSATFGNMISVAFASLLLPFLPMLPKQILLTNFITDFPYLSVASDNVDEDQVQQPRKWDLKLIRTYMIIFGIHSSLFDLMTFLLLYFILKAKESEFQTGWFVESVLTELFILFIIRTRKSFIKSKPGKYLLWLSLLGLIITIALPYSPLAREVGLIPLPFITLLSMIAIVAAYILTADWIKIWFFKKYQKPS